MFRWRRPNVNRIVLTFVYADFLFFTAAGFLAPIIAVYFADQINGGSIAVVGFATAIFWLVKSGVQIPVSIYADGHKGEGDDFSLMMTGFVLAAVVPLLYYYFAFEVWHVYVLEAMKGVAYAMLTPTYLAIFTRHIDKYKENTEWTLHSNAVGLGFAAAAAIGGILAERYGFRVVFLMVSAVSFLAPVTMLLVKDEIRNGGGGSDKGIEMQRKQQLITTKH